MKTILKKIGDCAEIHHAPDPAVNPGDCASICPRPVAAAFRLACRARPGKVVLKEMLTKQLPRRLFERPKHGFGMPVDEWYRGPLRHVLEKYTSSQRIRKRGLLNAETLQRFVQSHVSGRRNFGRKLHAIVAFEIWADQFFGDREVLG
jgi:asparagine synthetase B (glutamine-hydrolysing)